MKKLPVFLSIILLVTIISFISFFLDNRIKSQHIQRLQREAADLANQARLLQDVISSYRNTSQKNDDFNRDRKIRELLDSYLVVESQRDQIETTVSTEELKQEMSEYQKTQRFIPDYFPIKGEYAISQPFTENHLGIDIAAALGTEVLATGAGVVKTVYDDKYFGNAIIIDHLNNYHTFYAHLERVFVQKKLFVDKGEVIGLVGSTGYSTHPHLHYEVLNKGINIDPMSSDR